MRYSTESRVDGAENGDGIICQLRVRWQVWGFSDEWPEVVSRELVVVG